MKKNILTFLILTLCLANLTLTAILMFAMLPSFQKTNRLITQVSEILDLELTQNDDTEEAKQDFNIEDLESIEMTFGNKQTINLQRMEGQKEDKYALLESITVSLDKTAKDYKNINKLISENPSYIKNEVINIIGSCSIDNLNKEAICEQAVNRINELYKTNCVIMIILEGFTTN